MRRTREGPAFLPAGGPDNSRATLPAFFVPKLSTIPQHCFSPMARCRLQWVIQLRASG